MKKVFFVLSFLAIAMSTHAQEGQLKEDALEIEVGIDKVVKLDFAFSTKVQVGNESIMQLVLAPTKREITFRGLKEGKTSIIVRNNVGEIKKRYIVTVSSTGLSKTVQQLRELLAEVEGIDIGIKGEKVFVGGELVVPDDIGRVSAVLANYEEVLILVELSPLTRQVVARKMAEEIQRSGMRDVTVRVVNKAYWLEGVVNSADQKKLAMTIAEAYLPPDIASLATGSERLQTPTKKNAIYDFLSVNQQKKPQPPPKQIKISSQFVELSKDYGKVFAFKWNPLLGQDNSQITIGRTEEGDVSSSSSGTLSAVISNLFPKLSSAKNAGYARVLQSGMVITKDQQKATVSKQTQTPFAVGTGEFSRAQQANVGFNMDVQPKILEQEKVEMSVGIRVSTPSGSTNDGNPIISENSITTNLVVKSKQSAAIGGIVQNSSNTRYDKDDPDAGSNVEGGSNLFLFLRSKGFNTNKSQYVVFITPEIIESASLGTEEIRRKFSRRSR